MTLFLSFFSFAEEGPMGAQPPSTTDVVKVLASLRTCAEDKDFLENSMKNVTVLPANLSNNMQKEGQFSVTLNRSISQQAYSTHLWQAIVSGAEKLKALNWVVIADDNGKVVTSKKWDDVYSKNKIDCRHSQLMDCSDQTSKKSALP